MNRRALLAGVACAAASPISAQAQPARMLRVGAVTGLTRSAPIIASFEGRLQELGYQEGNDLSFDLVKVATPEAFDAGYRDVADRKPDIFLASGPEVSLVAARAHAGEKPIVMIAVDYCYSPIEKSLAVPIRDVTRG